MNFVLYTYYKEESPSVFVHVIITEKDIAPAIEKMAEQPFSD